MIGSSPVGGGTVELNSSNSIFQFRLSPSTPLRTGHRRWNVTYRLVGRTILLATRRVDVGRVEPPSSKTRSSLKNGLLSTGREYAFVARDCRHRPLDLCGGPAPCRTTSRKVGDGTRNPDSRGDRTRRVGRRP